jgi:predicted ester cyclase
MSSTREDVYRRFVAAVSSGDAVAAYQYTVPERFRAILRNKQQTPRGSGLDSMNFAKFMREINRQRTAFPDLGQNVVVHDISEDGDCLVATYVMTMRFTGPLRSYNGERAAQPPNGATLVISSQDHVRFEGTRIVEFKVVTDPHDTLDQLFG